MGGASVDMATRGRSYTIMGGAYSVGMATRGRSSSSRDKRLGAATVNQQSINQPNEATHRKQCYGLAWRAVLVNYHNICRRVICK